MATTRGAVADLPTRFGKFRIFAYEDDDGHEHAAIVKGEPKTGALVRLHSECLTGDLFGSLRCDCGTQLVNALTAIEVAGEGAVLYLRQEGRGIGLTAKIAAYQLQERGRDTVEANLELGHPADARTYDAARDMLADLGISSVRLMTNNPDKVEALRALGVVVDARVPHEVKPSSENKEYLRTKKSRMGHLLDGV